MIMMMGLIITMRTSDNGTLNCICHHMTQTITCFCTLQDVCALRGADLLTKQRASWQGEVEKGQELTRQEGRPFTGLSPGCLKGAPGKSVKLVLGIHV